TYPQEAARLRALMPSTLFLLPGYGAQGAGADDIVPAFDEQGWGAVVNASRSICYAYRAPQWRDRFPEHRLADAARAAFVDGFTTAAGAAAVLGVAVAAGAWLLLPRREEAAPGDETGAGTVAGEVEALDVLGLEDADGDGDVGVVGAGLSD
ncbi:MAG: hypothetical protein FWJ72_15900, partial [Acidimicrobiia bacterium]